MNIKEQEIWYGIHKSTENQIMQNKLSGTNDFAFEPPMDVLNSKISKLEESKNHELDTFEFETHSDLFLDEEEIALEVDLMLTDLNERKRSHSSTAMDTTLNDRGLITLRCSEDVMFQLHRVPM